MLLNLLKRTPEGRPKFLYKLYRLYKLLVSLGLNDLLEVYWLYQLS